MAKYVKCDCGFEMRAATEDEIVAMTQEHSRKEHNQEVSREQVLALVTDVD
jgi:predicted small metal-binding protein